MNCDRHRAIPAGDRAGYEMLNAYGKKSTRRQILGGDCASVGLRRATREMSLPSVIVTNGDLGCSAGANCNAGPRPKWCAHSRRLWGAKTWSEGPKTVQVPLVSLGGKRRNGFSVSRAKRSRNSSLPACPGEGGTKYLQAQLSIAYATGEMPFESRDFIYNECPNSECRFEIF